MKKVSTKTAETAQALFCSIIDNNRTLIGDIKKYKTYSELKSKVNNEIIKKAFKKVESEVPLKEIETVLGEDNSWYVSSKDIAIGILEQIDKFGKFQNQWQKIVYSRTTKDPIKKLINDLYKKGNNSLEEKSFSDINKWSPADIYFYTDKAENELSKINDDDGITTFSQINDKLKKLIEDGELAPISLKKHTRGNVTLTKVNFNRAEEVEKTLRYKFIDIIKNKDVDLYTKNGKKKLDKRKYFTIQVEEENDVFLNFRFSDKRFIIEQVIKNQARGGSTTATNKIKQLIDSSGNKELSDKMFGKDGVITKFKNGKIKDFGAAEELESIFREFKNNTKLNNLANKLAQEIIEYTGSRTKESAPFIIAK